MLYTRNNLNCAEALFEHNNSLNLNFNTQKKTVWLIHGYRPMGSTPSWLRNFLRVLLNEEDMNVIVVDWNRGATTFIYNRAVKNTRKVAENLSRHIQNLLVSLGIFWTMHSVHSLTCCLIPLSNNKIHFPVDKHMRIICNYPNENLDTEFSITETWSIAAQFSFHRCELRGSY